MNKQNAPIISGVVAAVAAFIIWLLFDNSLVSSIIFALLAGLLAFGVSFYQNRNRG
jgi:hypothetical protein